MYSQRADRHPLFCGPCANRTRATPSSAPGRRSFSRRILPRAPRHRLSSRWQRRPRWAPTEAPMKVVRAHKFANIIFFFFFFFFFLHMKIENSPPFPDSRVVQGHRRRAEWPRELQAALGASGDALQSGNHGRVLRRRVLLGAEFCGRQIGRGGAQGEKGTWSISGLSSLANLPLLLLTSHHSQPFFFCCANSSDRIRAFTAPRVAP
jgi:hypothetical protein